MPTDQDVLRAFDSVFDGVPILPSELKETLVARGWQAGEAAEAIAAALSCGALVKTNSGHLNRA